MRDLIEAKIDEIVKTVINKDVAQITYDEYKILKDKLKSIEEEKAIESTNSSISNEMEV